MNTEHGEFIQTRKPCPDSNCGSSDACSIRADNSAKCFSCNQNFKRYDRSYISIATSKPTPPLIEKLVLDCLERIFLKAEVST